MDTRHFSVAYPQGWAQENYPQQDGSLLYTVVPSNPGPQQRPVDVTVQGHASSEGAFSCAPSNGFQQVTLAGGQ